MTQPIEQNRDTVYHGDMDQEELPLEHTLLSLMVRPEPKMGWRRAHERRTDTGRKIDVSLVVINGDKGPRERMLVKQIPPHFKKPVRNGAKQLDIDL